MLRTIVLTLGVLVCWAGRVHGDDWTARYQTRDHTVDMTEHRGVGSITIDIAYDEYPVASLNFVPNQSGVFIYQPEDAWHGYYAYYDDCDCAAPLTHVSFWWVDEEIAPLYLTFSSNRLSLPPKATTFTTTSGLSIGVLTRDTVPPPPCGGWGGTNPCTGNGNPGYPGNHPDNPYAPNGGPGGNGAGSTGRGGRGGDGVGNGSGGAGGNGAGSGNGGNGGNGAGSGKGGNGGNGGNTGNGGDGGNGGNSGGNGGNGGPNGGSGGSGGPGGSGNPNGADGNHGTPP